MRRLHPTIAVVLLNLGGPQRLEDVEPFLYNLFSDRQIIRLGPALLQRPIARFIAWRRAPKSRAAYALIGGGSPLTRITNEQAAALEQALAADGHFRVVTAMRYWTPSARMTLQELKTRGIKRLVALPLYPHYSVATSGSSLIDLREAASLTGPSFEITEVRSWQTQARYIEALAATITDCRRQFPAEAPVQVVYSAHSLPKKFIDEGDPYVQHLRETIAAVERITGMPGRLCYQSRSGPVEWLSPSTPEMLIELAGQGCKNVLMVPISFVSDHVETLYEIDILYRQQAESLGMRLERAAALNLAPAFITALRELVLAAASGWDELGSNRGESGTGS